jgi:U3 small nucleolar RNA-associated protein 4
MLVAELNVKVYAICFYSQMSTNVVSTAMSSDGKWVAISDSQQVKLFKLSAGPDGLRIQKSRTFDALEIPHGANGLRFTPDSTKLIIASLDSILRVVSIEGSEFSLVASLRQHCGDHEKAGMRKRALIHQITISSDSKWLASGDVACRLFLTNLETLEVRFTRLF